MSGFLSPNNTPQALPLERPEQGPVIPTDTDTESESEVDYSQNTQIPFGFIPMSKPPSEPANQTPKMISSNNWGQHSDWGNAGSSGNAAGPSESSLHSYHQLYFLILSLRHLGNTCNKCAFFGEPRKGIYLFPSPWSVDLEWLQDAPYGLCSPGYSSWLFVSPSTGQDAFQSGQISPSLIYQCDF